jgi:prepilin-type N-terminal cleavage/methylation domain-containing protein
MQRGFTLLEILVALLVLTIAVSAVLQSQLYVLKVEQKSRILQLFRFETERIYSVTQRAKSEEELAQLLTTNNICRLKSEQVEIESGTNKIVFLKYEMNDANLPLFPACFYSYLPNYAEGKDLLAR